MAFAKSAMLMTIRVSHWRFVNCTTAMVSSVHTLPPSCLKCLYGGVLRCIQCQAWSRLSPERQRSMMKKDSARRICESHQERARSTDRPCLSLSLTTNSTHKWSENIRRMPESSALVPRLSTREKEREKGRSRAREREREREHAFTMCVAERRRRTTWRWRVTEDFKPKTFIQRNSRNGVGGRTICPTTVLIHYRSSAAPVAGREFTNAQSRFNPVRYRMLRLRPHLSSAAYISCVYRASLLPPPKERKRERGRRCLPRSINTS